MNKTPRNRSSVKSSLHSVMRFRLPRRNKSMLPSRATLARPTHARAKQRSIFDDSANASEAGDSKAAMRSIDYSLNFTVADPDAGLDDTTNANSTLPRITAQRVFQKIADNKRQPSTKQTFNRYIQRLSRQMFEAHLSTSPRGRITLSDFATEMFDVLAEQAATMVRSTDRRTLTEWDVMQAVKIVLPPGLASDACSFAHKKMETYRQSRS